MSFYFQGIDPPSLITARESAPRRVGFPFSQVLLCNFGLLNMNATIIVVASRCFLCENKIYKVAIEPHRQVGVDVHRCIQSNRLTGAVNIWIRRLLRPPGSVKRALATLPSVNIEQMIHLPIRCLQICSTFMGCQVNLPRSMHRTAGKINGQLN